MSDFLSAQLHKLYADNIQSGKPYFTAEQCQFLLTSNVNSSLCSDLLNFAASFSVSPLSKFSVGCVALGASGRYYLGANIEFLGFPLNYTIHAEQAAVAMAYVSGEEKIEKIFVSAMPCGHCRQFLRENFNYESLQIEVIQNQGKDCSSFSLTQLLPHSFGAEALNIKESLFSRKIMNSPLFFTRDNSKGLDDEFQDYANGALQQSFSPYSKDPAAVVLVFENGFKIAGFSIESCAFNPSLFPLHVALIQCIFYRLPFDSIMEIFCFHDKNSSLNWEYNVKNISKILAPNAALKVINF